jgi:hypothetical protein
VTIFPRRFSPLAVLRSASTRRSPLAAACALVFSAALLGAAAPALAVVTTVGSTTVGLQTRNNESIFESGMPTAASFSNPEGNPVLHKNETYAVYWDPTDHYHGDWQHLIDTFFHSLGADSGSTGTVFAVDSQYADKSNLPAYYLSTFRGAYTDTDPYPVGASNCKDPHPLALVDRIGPGNTEVCLTDAQIRTELRAFIAAHGLQTGVRSIFYLLTPPAVTVCLQKEGELGTANHCSDHTGSVEETATESYENSFCSYHSDFSNLTLENVTTPDANTILYGVIPWSAGGQGDYHLTRADRTPAFDCQDGGWYLNPQTHFVEREKAKEPKIESKKEEEEHPKNAEEKQQQKEAEEKAKLLEGPHEEEPNQIGLGPDGSYDTGLADLIVSQIGVQQQNIVTNPLLNAWQDSARNEVTDECRNDFLLYQGGSATADEFTFGGTLYNQSFTGTNAYINDSFNLAATKLPYPGVPCMTGINVDPQFTAPNLVNGGELVGFDGMESNITLDAGVRYSTSATPEANYATYNWNFGDGSAEVKGYAPGAPTCETPWLSPCAASVFHSYQYGGTYTVTLTVTDVGGNVATTSQAVTVNGPPSPAPTPAPGTQGSAGSGAGGLTAVNPIAAAAVISRSLKTVLHKGLVVRYSVNEQVAGHFEVLLDSATAKRLKISGTPAVGLPAGTPPEVVIAKAILVTTKGGRSALRIKFSKRTAARLAHTHKIKLMLRLTVHNATPGSPVSTTVLSSFTLSH